MLQRLSTLMLVLALLVVATPLRAAERVMQAPTITPVTSGFLDIAVAALLTERPSQQPWVAVQVYGQGRFGPGRIHVVSVDITRNKCSDVKTIDNTMFVKLPGAEHWEQSQVQGGATTTPMMPPIDPQLQIYRVGDTEVRGAATTQYQIPVPVTEAVRRAATTQDPAPVPAPAESQQPVTRSTTLDLFVGKAGHYLHKIQTSVRSSDRAVGELAVEAPIEISASNQPQSIEPPPADQVRTMRSAAVSDNHLPGAQALPTWLRPILAQALTTC